MKKQITTLLALAMAGVSFAQETSATLYGYVRGEFAFDSRQVIAAREGNYIDLAKPIDRDAAGTDLNGVANFNGWGVESRLGVRISGPEFFGMKSNAVLEGHFFGTNEQDINSLSLRHAYVQLSNDNVEILVGQYWHPMFVTNVSPMTYNFNAGSPFQPFNRSPQIRVTTKGDVRFTAAAITERDFTSVSNGGSAAKSGLPAFHAQIQTGNDNKFVAGAGVNYKSLRVLGAGTGVGKTVGAWNFLAYYKAKFGGDVAWQAYANYGQNPTELLQLGGLAINNTGEVKNSKTLAVWTEFFGNFSPSFEWGIFGGYSKDYGFSDGKYMLPTNAYTQGTPGQVIVPESTWRVSPRLGWKSGNTKLTAELDYTSTTWGNYGLETGTVYYNGAINKLSKEATGDNFRVSLSLIQSF